MKKRNIYIIGILVATLFAFTSKNILPEVKTISAMKKVMMGQDLSAHVQWDTIPRDHLFAIAPLGRIQGEVTIIDGKIYSSTVNTANQIVMHQDWNIQSPFAVFANVSEWSSFEAETTINNEEELQAYIERIASENGYSIDEAFPYRVIGEFSAINFHIISKPLHQKEHNHDLHNKSKKHFHLENVKGELLGFYSKHHEGVFTHRGHYSHTHFIDENKENMGHLESLTVNKKLILLLPKIK